ncbi:MAG: DCC1-like thiol-disulfide oxidoreductase family protein [Pseudomonadota bacterium]
MMEISDRTPYAYRADPSVPAFPDDGPVLFVDGACTLCSHWARFVARHDRQGRIRLCAVQSPLGRAVMRHFGLDAEDPDSWLCLIDGRAYGGMRGIAEATGQMGGWVRWLGRLAMLPPGPVRRWLYARVARNRYRLLGRTALCTLPDAALRARLIG